MRLENKHKGFGRRHHIHNKRKRERQQEEKRTDIHKEMCTEADLQRGLLGDTQINRSITNIVSGLHAENSC